MNFILRNESAIYYECGYSCDNAIYLNLGSEAYFLTDGRYTIEAKESVKGAKVIISNNILKEASKLLKGIKRCSYDPKEWDCFSLNALNPDNSFKWVEKLNFSQKRRIIKTPKEIELLKRASKEGAKAFKKIAKAFNREGFNQSEKALSCMAEYLLRSKGERLLSFEPIVAIGANAAKPHAVATDTKLKEGNLLLLDAGIKYKRYCSDRTRTVYAKEGFKFNLEQKFKSKKIQRAYDTVLKAHDEAIKRARSGMRAKEIDAIAREIIEKKGYGKYFVHSTGHGVGLDIHELPIISSRCNSVIENSMVFTIEPGIYIPNEFGIRIEDTVVMRDSRAEIL